MAPIENPALVFTGFMGAGKSRALRHAKAAGLDAVDADLLLAEELGGSIADFFAANGEEEFRRREAELVLRVLSEGHAAVALGGGAVLSEAVREVLGAHTVVWLRVPPSELWRHAQGSNRPLARDEAEFKRLYAEREPLYRELADAVMLSADALPDALDALLGLASSDADEADLGREPVGLLPGVDRRGHPRHGGRRRSRQAVLRERHERGAALPGRRRHRGGDRRPRR